MGISYIGAAIGVNSASLPVHIQNDIIIGFSFRDGSTSPPTAPGGWTIIQNPTGANACSATLAYIIGTGSTVSGTWTNGTNTLFLVYRGIRIAQPIGANQVATGSGLLLTVPALTLQYQDNTSWILNFNGVRTTLINLQIPPLGFVTRISDARLQGNDTNAPVSTFAGVNLSLGITLTGWEAMSLELLDNCGPVASPTPTPTISVTPTLTPSFTPTLTRTITTTQTCTVTPADTNTPTPTLTVTFTPSNTITPTPTITPTDTITPTPTETLTPTPTITGTVTNTPTMTCSTTNTPTITTTPSVTITRTVSHTMTMTRTSTSQPTPTPTVTPSH